MKEKEKKKEDFQIPEEALQKIKSQEELYDFFHELYKQGRRRNAIGRDG